MGVLKVYDGADWQEVPIATDHGELTGLGDDDHPHYLTETRGDALYAQVGGALTANRALVSNIDGEVLHSDITATELGRLDGVTSDIQTQLDAKVDGHSEDENVVLCSDGSGGVQEGPRWIDTSVGQNGYTFPGHFARYLTVNNVSGSVDIEKGDVVMWVGNTSPRDDVIQRNDYSHQWAGGALEDIDFGESGKIAVDGHVDVKCENSYTGTGNVVHSIPTSTYTHYMVRNSSSGYTVGHCVGGTGTAYYWEGGSPAHGWARLRISQESS